VDILQGFGLGADDYLVKPFSPMELAARLKRLLARSV
jgi:two-component system OmpR family response regulator